MVYGQKLICLVLFSTYFRWIALHIAAGNGHLNTVQWRWQKLPILYIQHRLRGNSILVKNYLT